MLLYLEPTPKRTRHLSDECLGSPLNNFDALKVLSTDDILNGSKEFQQLFSLLNALKLPQSYITQVYDDILKLKRMM